MLTRFPLVASLTLLLALPAAAPAATKNGITPLAPKAGGVVASGKSPTFRMRVRGSGQVWVHVCKSRKKKGEGVICSEESIGRAKKSGGVFKFTPEFFDFPEFWLNSPGQYYWQAHRIKCVRSDCRQEGPIIAFSVAA